MTVTLEDGLAIFCKVKHRLTVWPNNLTPEFLPQRNENLCLSNNVYISCIYNSPKLEGIQMSFCEWVREQTLVYPYNRILLRIKRTNYWYTEQFGWLSKTWCCMKEASLKGLHIALFHLYCIMKKARLSGMENRWSGFMAGGRDDYKVVE